MRSSPEVIEPDPGDNIPREHGKLPAAAVVRIAWIAAVTTIAVSGVVTKQTEVALVAVTALAGLAAAGK